MNIQAIILYYNDLNYYDVDYTPPLNIGSMEDWLEFIYVYGTCDSVTVIYGD